MHSDCNFGGLMLHHIKQEMPELSVNKEIAGEIQGTSSRLSGRWTVAVTV